jgi:hypothetical protein
VSVTFIPAKFLMLAFATRGRMRRGASFLVLVSLALIGAPVKGQEPGGGGTVENVAPTVETFTNRGTALNEGSTDVFRGTVRDANGETDLVAIRVATVSGPSVTLARNLTANDLNQTAEPASFTGGWKVWNPTPEDGVIAFSVQHTYPVGAVNQYTWAASARDEGNFTSGPANTITVQIRFRITVTPGVVLQSGSTVLDQRWGGWSARPGDTNIESTSYVKVTNTGVNASQTFTLDFTDTAFAGTNAATVPIDGNIQFAAWEDTTPDSTSPEEGIFTYGSTSATGSATFSYSAVDNVILVKYRLVALPAVVPDQTYTAAFTVTAV